MKKTGITLLLTIFIISGFSQGAKMDYQLRTIVNGSKSSQFKSTGTSKSEKFNKAKAFYIKDQYKISTETEDPMVSVLLKYSGDIEGALAQYGLSIGSKTSQIATLRAPLSLISKIAEAPEVLGIQLSKPMRPRLDQSVAQVKGTISEYSKLFTEKTGTGVIVGIIDVGFDIYHPTFWESNTKTRIKGFWDMKTNTKYTSAQIESKSYTLPTYTDVEEAVNYGHGTSVASIAAGNGRDASGTVTDFKGIATGADILLVQVSDDITATENDIIDGINWIAEKAIQSNLPWVVNLSLGSLNGSRNGTSYFESAIQEIISSSSKGKGRVVVVAAGNDGSYIGTDPFANDVKNLSKRKHTYNPGNGSNSFRVNSDVICPIFWNGPAEAMKRDFVSMEIYLQPTSGYTCKLTSPNGMTIQVTAPPVGELNAQSSSYSSDGDMVLNWARRPTEEEDIIFVDISDNLDGSNYLKSGEWKIEMTGGTGEWDAYIVYENIPGDYKNPPYFLKFDADDNTRIMGEPANVKDVITVGSINSTKISWNTIDVVDIAGTLVQVPGTNSTAGSFSTGANKVSYFSSPGPARPSDAYPNGTKQGPDVYAPGTNIACARASNIDLEKLTFNKMNCANIDYMVRLEGTSFSAPHVTGTAALILQMHPEWSFQEVKDIITGKTTLKSGTTGGGVLDIYNAIETARNITSNFFINKSSSTSVLTKGASASFTAINKSTTTASGYNWTLNFFYKDNNGVVQKYKVQEQTGGSITWTTTLPSTLPANNWLIDVNGNIEGILEAGAVYNGVVTMIDAVYICCKIAPLKPVVSVLNTNDGSVTLYYNSSGAQSYKIYYGTKPYDLTTQGTNADQGSSPITITANEYNTYTLSGLNQNQYIWFTAVNESGEGANSEYVVFRKYQKIPYSTGFENGLENNWTFAPVINGTSNAPVIDGVNTPYSGSKQLVLASSNTTFQDSYFDMNLNLSEENNVIMEFWFKDFGDVFHNQDGVWLSDDGGITFVKGFDIDPTKYTDKSWQKIKLDIGILAKSKGLSLSKTFVVRIHQYDNATVPTKGFAIDDISFSRGLTAIDIEDALLLYCEKPGYTNYQTTNYGNVPVIEDMEWTNSNAIFKKRSLINFNLKNIEPGSVIESAKLSLYGTGDHYNYTTMANSTYKLNASYLSRVVQPWDEYIVTWNTMPQYTTTDQVLLSESTTKNQNYVADITNLIQYQVDEPGSAYGLMLRLNNETKYARMSFGSSDNTNVELRPSIDIKYHLNVQSLTVYPDKDAQICTSLNPNQTSWQTTNYGSSTIFSALEWTYSNYQIKHRSLIDFDLSSLPEGAFIVDAKLSLYGTGEHANNIIMNNTTYKSNASRLYLIRSPWEENAVTWVNQPAIDTKISSYLTTSKTLSQNYLDIDVTTALREMVANPNKAFGLMLALENEMKYARMYFASSDNATVALRPKLVITYTTNPSNLKAGTVTDISKTAMSDNKIHKTINETEGISVQPTVFSNETNIIVNTLKESKVTIVIFDIEGNPVNVIVDDILPAGSYTYTFKPSDSNSQVYILQSKIGEEVTTQKLIKQ